MLSSFHSWAFCCTLVHDSSLQYYLQVPWFRNQHKMLFRDPTTFFLSSRSSSVSWFWEHTFSCCFTASFRVNSRSQWWQTNSSCSPPFILGSFLHTFSCRCIVSFWGNLWSECCQANLVHGCPFPFFFDPPSIFPVCFRTKRSAKLGSSIRGVKTLFIMNR